MTSLYQLPLYGFRFVEIQFGDTLQAIAARELGDASGWAKLIAINGLVPPYITDDPDLVVPGVLLSGGALKVPAPQPVVTTTTDPDQVFLSDIALSDTGALVVVNGDFALTTGRPNLHQALTNRVETDRGELIFHPGYGSRIRRILGTVNGPTAELLAAKYAAAAVLADSRIKEVTAAVAQSIGDQVQVSVEAVPIVGRPITINAIV